MDACFEARLRAYADRVEAFLAELCPTEGVTTHFPSRVDARLL